MSCWTLLQAPGEAVLVPAGAPHQVGPRGAGALLRAQNARNRENSSTAMLHPPPGMASSLSRPGDLGWAGSALPRWHF